MFNSTKPLEDVMDQQQYDNQVRTDSKFLSESIHKLYTIKWMFLASALALLGYSVYCISDYWYCYWICNNPTCGPAMRWGVMLTIIAVLVLIATFIYINVLAGDLQYAKREFNQRVFEKEEIKK